MREQVTGLNHRMLTWARERAGKEIEQVARELKREPGEVRAWEAGTSAPTYAQLEKLAYTVLKRPLALFFFPEPPDEPDPEHSFRTLPAVEQARLSSDSRFKFRMAQALRLSLVELCNGRNPAPRHIFRDLKLGQGEPVPAAAKAVREYLGVSFEMQVSWKNSDQALKEWRQAIEGVGVFVFKSSFKQKEISGFCLYDSEFPLIYVNNSTAKTRQIFTLFHELAHILLGESGVTKVDFRYPAALKGWEAGIEVFCNQFAAEFLAPEGELRGRLTRRSARDDEAVRTVADAFHVSREVILRRCLDLGWVPPRYYETKVDEWLAEYRRQVGEREGSGGDYYATQAAYLGPAYLDLVFGKYFEGDISLPQAADHLNIKASSFSGLEEVFLKQAVSG